MYKLIGIDIDGTLLNDKHEVTPEVCEAIEEAKKQGVKIVLCTGRAISGVRQYVKKLGLNGEDDFVAAFNGGIVQRTFNEETVVKIPMKFDDIKKIHQLSRKLGVSMNVFDESKMYTLNKEINRYTVLDAYLLQIDFAYRTLEELSEDMTFLKVVFVDEPERLAKAIDSIPREFWENYAMVKSAPFYFEFLHPEASKGNAVRKIAEMLGIKREEVMCIGDSGNDLSMIQYAGLGVAMENAMDVLKKHADYITLSNNESGVAHAIRKFILEKD